MSYTLYERYVLELKSWVPGAASEKLSDQIRALYACPGNVYMVGTAPQIIHQVSATGISCGDEHHAVTTAAV